MNLRASKFQRILHNRNGRKRSFSLSKQCKVPCHYKRKKSTTLKRKKLANLLKHNKEDLPNNEKLSSVSCSICRLIYRDPFTLLPCEHSFCNPCISVWLMKNFSCPLCRGVPTSFQQNSNCAAEVFKWKLRSKFNPIQCADLVFQESVSCRNDLLHGPSMTKEEFLRLPPLVAGRSSTNVMMEQLRLHTSQLRSRLTEVTTNLYGILGEVERVNAEIDRLSTRISMHLSERRTILNNQISEQSSSSEGNSTNS